MIQGMSSVSSLNIHFCPNKNSSFHLSYLACWQQCPGHCSIKKPWLILVHEIQDEHDYTKPPEVTQDSDHTLQEPEKPDRAR